MPSQPLQLYKGEPDSPHDLPTLLPAAGIKWLEPPCCASVVWRAKFMTHTAPSGQKNPIHVHLCTAPTPLCAWDLPLNILSREWKCHLKICLADEENHQSTQCNATHVVEFAMLLFLACSNREAKQRKAFKGGNFHELQECPIRLFLSLLGFRLHVTCLKMSLLQFRFSCQSES